MASNKRKPRLTKYRGLFLKDHYEPSRYKQLDHQLTLLPFSRLPSYFPVVDGELTFLESLKELILLGPVGRLWTKSFPFIHLDSSFSSKDDTLQHEIRVLDHRDLNTLPDQGYYYCNDCLYSPISRMNGFLRFVQDNEGNATQTYVICEYAESVWDTTWVRTKVNGVWHKWLYIPREDEVKS